MITILFEIMVGIVAVMTITFIVNYWKEIKDLLKNLPEYILAVTIVLAVLWVIGKIVVSILYLFL
jgi:hypothetical protein